MTRTIQEIVSEIGLAYLRNMPTHVLLDEVRRRKQEDAEDEVISEGMELHAWLCEQLYVDPDVMNGSWRPSWLSDKRAIAIYVTHMATTLSLNHVGRIFNRDHASVLHSKKKVLASPVLLVQAAHLLKTWEGVQP